MVRGSGRLKPHWGSCGGQDLAKLRIRVQVQWCESIINLTKQLLKWCKITDFCFGFLGVQEEVTERVNFMDNQKQQ